MFVNDYVLEDCCCKTKNIMFRAHSIFRFLTKVGLYYQINIPIIKLTIIKLIPVTSTITIGLSSSKMNDKRIGNVTPIQTPENKELAFSHLFQ